MSTSIYGILNYAAGTTYSKWDIVKSSSLYWYSKVDANIGNTPGTTSSYWDGNTTFASANGETRPKFIWTPSYNPAIVSEPRVNVIAFGDGYEQRNTEGINFDLLKLDLVFEKRNIAETTALLHFLHERKAQEPFVYTPPIPYDSTKLFVARTWNMSQVFYNNYSVRVLVQEIAG